MTIADGWHLHVSSWDDSSKKQDEVSDDSATVDELKAKIATLQSKLSHLKNLSYEAGRQVRDEKKRYEELEQQTAHDRLELADLRELVFNQQENLYHDEARLSVLFLAKANALR